jgi:hypothetical protein
MSAQEIPQTEIGVQAIGTNVAQLPVRARNLAILYNLCYYNTMRSQRTPDLNRHVNQLRASGMLQFTVSQRRHASEALEPVPYFVIPRQAARKMGTMVTSLVNIDGRGILSLTAPKAYGVVDRPSLATAEHSGMRLREAHVIAEDAALRRGLYTPYGRAAAEIFVAKMVAEDNNIPSYIPDSVSHLEALVTEIETEDVFNRIPQIVGEIDRGIESLQAYADEYQS